MSHTIFLRHGQTHYSQNYLANGDPSVNVPLNDHGRQECQRLHTQDWNHGLKHCFHSAFPRTLQSITRIKPPTSATLIEMNELNELNYGMFEGQPWMHYGQWIHDHHPWRAPPGGESRFEAFCRYIAAIRKIRTFPGPRLVVGHGIMLSLIEAVNSNYSLQRWDLPPALTATPVIYPDQDLSQWLRNATIAVAACAPPSAN